MNGEDLAGKATSGSPVHDRTRVTKMIACKQQKNIQLRKTCVYCAVRTGSLHFITTNFWLPGQSMWDLWWTKWQWDRFFSQYIGFPLSVSLHQFSYQKDKRAKPGNRSKCNALSEMMIMMIFSNCDCAVTWWQWSVHVWQWSVHVYTNIEKTIYISRHTQTVQKHRAHKTEGKTYKTWQQT